MDFKYQGLFVSIIILICLLIVCHTSNFLYTKKYKNNKNLNSFLNVPVSIPTKPLAKPLATQYNKIIYENQNDMSVCNQINEAQIPCKIISDCSNKNKESIEAKPTQTLPYELSESEIAVLYRDMYASAGREVLSRGLNISVPTSQNPSITTSQKPSITTSQKPSITTLQKPSITGTSSSIKK